MEVAQVWNHAPPSWHAHVDHTLVETTADLIKLASDKEEQLQASSADQIQRLVRAELQRAQAGGLRRPYSTPLAVGILQLLPLVSVNGDARAWQLTTGLRRCNTVYTSQVLQCSR